MAVTYQNKDHWFLFLLFPFLAGVVAIKNYKAPWAKNIIWAFFVFYGFTFGTGEGNATDSESADITRYISEVKQLYKKDLTFDQVVNLYAKNDDIDILKLTLAIGISRVTDSQQVVTTIYSFIF